MKLILYWVLALGCAFAFCGEGDFSCRVRAERQDGHSINKGTASAISAHTLVTAGHVVADADDVFIEHELGWLRCRVVTLDRDADLAILECKTVELKFIPLDVTARHAGETITLWSSILGNKIKAIAGHLRSRWDAVPRARWLCDAPTFDHGGSGSPVVADGKLIGVATALQADTHGEAVPNTAIMVPSVCVQRLIVDAPVIAAPDTKAEVVELPTPKVKAPEIAIPTEFPRVTLELPKNCHTGTCRAATPRAFGARTAACAARHWDSDVDGHGQGGWVAE